MSSKNVAAALAIMSALLICGCQKEPVSYGGGYDESSYSSDDSGDEDTSPDMGTDEALDKMEAALAKLKCMNDEEGDGEQDFGQALDILGATGEIFSCMANIDMDNLTPQQRKRLDAITDAIDDEETEDESRDSKDKDADENTEEVPDTIKGIANALYDLGL